MTSPPVKCIRQGREKDIIAKAAYAVTFIPAMLLWTGQALASQGPGTKPGTASAFTQWGMAILVYGTSALVIGIGLIGAARRH